MFRRIGILATMVGLGLTLYGSALLGADGDAGKATTNDPPKNENDRIWYPETNIQDPTELVGFFVFVDTAAGNKLRPLAHPFVKRGTVVKVKFDQPSTVHAYTFKKGDGGGLSIPGIAAAKLEEGEVQSLTVTDVASAILPIGAYVDICQAWPELKDKRSWKLKDPIYYIYGTQMSTVASKNGKEHKKDASFGIGNYFSANGNQYDATTDMTFISATSLKMNYNEVTSALLANRCHASTKMSFGGKPVVNFPRIDGLATDAVDAPHKAKLLGRPQE